MKLSECWKKIISTVKNIVSLIFRKKKMKFEYNTRYETTIENFSFGPVSEKILIEQFMDGRISGKLIEAYIAEIFDEMSCGAGGNGNDLLHKSYGIGEVKTYTKNGCSLLPSCQKGAGRKYNHQKYVEYIKRKNFFMVVDIRSFPKISIIALESKDVLDRYSGSEKSKPKVDESIMFGKKTIQFSERK